jgi:multidrug efflux pump subunit AcrA (membrane-fusion protein)
MRLKIMAAVILIAVGVGSVGFVILGPSIFGAGQTQQYLTATATRTNVVKQVVATGTVSDKAVYGLAFGQPAQLTSSTSTTSGASAASGGSSGGSSSWRVKTVQVSIGDKVTAGQELATADTTDLQAQVAIAEANLASAEARLTVDQAGATPENKAVAQDSVSQAELSYRNTLQSQKDAAAQAAVNLAQAQAAVDKARAQLAADQAGPSAAELASYQDAVSSAQLALTTAQQNLANVQAQNVQSEAAAQLAVSNAQAKLASDQDPGSSVQLAVRNAQTNLSDVQSQINQAELVPRQDVSAECNTLAGYLGGSVTCPADPTQPLPDPGCGSDLTCAQDYAAYQDAYHSLMSLVVKDQATLH